MKYEKTTFWINIFTAIVYGVVNILFTFITGNPVYPPVLTWDSIVSWVIGAAVVPFWGLVFYIEYWLTNSKMKKVKKEESENLLQHTSTASV